MKVKPFKTLTLQMVQGIMVITLFIKDILQEEVSCGFIIPKFNMLNGIGNLLEHLLHV